MKKIVPHTPGPWRQGFKRPDRVYQVEKSGDRDIKVAQTIVHADARLIAAAPELLEALEGAQQAVHLAYQQAHAEWQYVDKRAERLDDQIRSWRETARAAIAKATGIK